MLTDADMDVNNYSLELKRPRSSDQVQSYIHFRQWADIMSGRFGQDYGSYK